ncbi:MAG: ABC transporter ATP-binding protein [Deltaproteobacteria bacterium]|nr:ABC transporter ATP-binding protein [Deltaproteobacteria bacterium]
MIPAPFQGTAADEPLIQVNDLTKAFVLNQNRIDVLTGVNLTLSRASSMAIVGASGVGKSTLLNIIGTLEQPTSGTVMLAGEDVFNLNQLRLASFRNRRIGFVFQFHHLLPEFNALENVMLPGLIARMSKKEAGLLAEQRLTDVGLKDRLKHKVGELSGGEQQRVAVARALFRSPEVLLADEPTGNLDTNTGRRIHELLLKLNKENQLTMIVVTHNPELAGMMSRRMTLIDGKAVELS